jgi:hypothetical protein
MHLIVILQPTIESSLRRLFFVIMFLSKFLNQVAFMAEILLPSNVESFSPKNLGDLPFDSHSDVVSGITHSCSIH